MELNCVQSYQSCKPPKGTNPSKCGLMKVLVVEDDPFVRQMAVTGLEEAAFEVIEAACGSQALEFLQAGVVVDALLTDIRLPGANGWAVARAYRERFPDLPVLYVTGYAGADAACPRRDHHLEALQDGSGDWRPGNMGGLRETVPFGTGSEPPALTDMVFRRRSPHARFFFDIHDGEDFTSDRQGLDLDGLEAAKDAAKKDLPDIVKDEMPDGDRRDFTVDVKNVAGQIVWRITLSLVVESPSRIARGYLGLGLQPVRIDQTMADAAGLAEPKGLIVISVDPNGPGQRAGIKQGDILIRWDADPLHSVRGVYTLLGPESVGQSVALGMLRAGKQISLTVEIEERSKPQE